MRRVMQLTVCCLWVLCASHATGQTNAADLYWKIDADFHMISDQDWESICESSANDPTAPVPLRVQQLVQSHSGARRQILRATHMSHCNFLLGEIIGPTVHLRHLSLVHRVESFLLIDSKSRMQRGDYDGAVQSLVGILGLASHVQSDQITTSSILSQEMMIDCVQLTNYLAQIGALDHSRATQLLEAMNRFDPADPGNIRKATANMANTNLAWMKKNYESGDYQAIQSSLPKLGTTDLDLKSVDPIRFQEALDHDASALDSVVKIMETTENPEDQKNQIQMVFDLLNKDELASKLFPFNKQILNFSWELTTMRTRMAEQRAFLDDISQSRHTSNDVANAAFWYARGTKSILEIPDDVWRVQIAKMSRADEVVSLDSRWQERLDSALKQFREGSSIKNCDWSVLRRDIDGVSHSLHIAPAYIAGVWRAVEYLNTLSVRESPTKPNEIQARSYSNSKDNIATSVRLVAHLAGDNVLASSCFAHELFRKLKPALERIAADEQMPHDDFERIRATVWLLSPSDPCGYLKSGTSTRHDLANFLAEKFPEVKVAGDPVQDIGRFVQTLRAGQLVSGLMLAEMSTKKSEVEGSPNWFAGHTTPIARDMFIQIVGTKRWEESENFAVTELALLKSATEKEPLKIEPLLTLDVTARHKQTQEEVKQLRSTFSKWQERELNQSTPPTEKSVSTVEK